MPDMGCLAIFFLRYKAFHEVEPSFTFATDCSNFQHHCTVYHLIQQLFSQFYGSFNVNKFNLNCTDNYDVAKSEINKKGACAHFSFCVPRSSVYENKLIQDGNSQHRQLATLHFQALRDKMLTKLRSVTA